MRHFHQFSLASLMLAVVACGGAHDPVGPRNGDAGTGDAGAVDEQVDAGTAGPTAADAGTSAQVDPTEQPGQPFTTPPNEWTWVDIDGSVCADGTPTGAGVNINPDSEDVLIFLEGGGACWDYASCWGLIQTSFNVTTGYGRFEWATDPQRLLLPLLRDNSSNPWSKANLIYVPYCTGDIHVGDSVQTYSFLGIDRETHHHGYRNLGLVLDRVKATWPNLKHLWLAGDSAGGFGAAFNLDRTQRRFPEVRVDVLDDSGPPIQPMAGLWTKLRSSWNAQLPDDCATCQDSIGAMVDYYQQKYPNNRVALISNTNDAVITTFMQLPPQTFWDELMALASHVDQSWPNAHYYYLPGISHVGLLTPTPGLVDWMQKFATDDPSWSSWKP